MNRWDYLNLFLMAVAIIFFSIAIVLMSARIERLGG